MKWMIAVCMMSLFLRVAHAQEGAPAGAPPAAVDASPGDSKEFNQDLDDFEKNMSKEVPPPKNKGAGVPGLKKDTAGDKARATMKKQLEESGKKPEKAAGKSTAKKPSKKSAKKAEKKKPKKTAKLPKPKDQ